MNLPVRLLALLAAAAVLPACSTAPSRTTVAPAVFSTGFESGNLGQVTATGDTTWRLQLRNDNDDPSLPETFRTWFYFGLDGFPAGRPLTLKLSGFGSNYPAVPVYSYDRVHWRHFDEADLAWRDCAPDALARCELTVHKTFARPQVWIARFFPYTTRDLDGFLATHAASPYLAVHTLALSPASQVPIQLLTIADPPASGRVADDRRYVWIQARSHPGETGSSFLLEGLIARLLADDESGRALRARYVFEIVPIHNVDGVILGNYRSNASSINLEASWAFDPAGGPLPGIPAAPPENQALMQAGILPLLRGGARFAMALNLHSSNAEPDKPAFFVPHFGANPSAYTGAQRRLWQKQARFIELAAQHYDDRIWPPAAGGTAFLDDLFPERWWWTAQQDHVNAITLETTYGRAGFDHWITRDDLRRLGDAIARAIGEMDDTEELDPADF